MRTALQLPNTVDPPVWHTVGDTYDPLSVAFYTGNAGGFTSAAFDNGDGLSQTLFGPPRYCKDGWIAYFEGFFTVPTQSGAYDINVCTLPAAYVPAPSGLVAPATQGIWSGSQGFALALIFTTGEVHINTTGVVLANAQWGSITAAWPTNTYGE